MKKSLIFSLVGLLFLIVLGSCCNKEHLEPVTPDTNKFKETVWKGEIKQTEKNGKISIREFQVDFDDNEIANLKYPSFPKDKLYKNVRIKKTAKVLEWITAPNEKIDWFIFSRRWFIVQESASIIVFEVNKDFDNHCVITLQRVL